MADPLSVAGLAAGVISLGLQVCGGITKYIEALECREQDIASAKQQNHSLRQALELVQTCLVRLQHDDMHQAAATEVRDCVQSSTQELNALDALVGELTGHGQSMAGRGSRIKAQGRKLLYPFSRPKLAQLETRLRNANATLQLTMQAIGLSLSQQGAGKLAALESSFHNLAINQLASIQSEVSAMTSPLQDIHGTLRGLNARYDNLEQLVMQLISPDSAVNGTSPEITSEAVAGRLLAKPAALRAVCDNFGYRTRPVTGARPSARNHSAAQPRDTLISSRGTFFCSCRSRRFLSRRNLVLGPLTLFLEATDGRHLPGCPAAHSADPDRRVGLRYNGLRRLLNVVVQVSFTMTTNAGGCSIGSSVTYYPTVDPRTAPAFRIIGLLYQAYLSCDYSLVTSSQHAELVSHARSTILRLFQAGKASPRAVDDKNQSLIHRLADCMRIEHLSWWDDIEGHSAASLMELLKLLIAHKAPANDYDTSPVSLMFPGHDDYDDSTTCNVLFAASELVLESGEGTLARVTSPSLKDWVQLRHYSRPYTRRCTVKNILDFLACSPNIAEAYGCGPLSLAIIANNVDTVEHLLRNHPGTLKERNLFGQSPLHLAVARPACLRLLVQAADSTLLNGTDCRNMSAFEVALAISESRYHRQGGAHCACAGSAVAILLEADCALPVPSSLQLLLYGASRCCTQLYIRHLVDRRKWLKRLALDNLSEPEAEALGLFRPAVLDYLAPQACQLLEQRGVRIPEALRVQRAGSPPIASVYQALEEPAYAELFFRAGFRDTDSVLKPGGAENGCSPGLMGPHLFVRWLAKRGVDVVHARLRSFPSGRALFTAHYTLYSIAGHFPRYGIQSNDIVGWFSASKLAWIRDVHAAALAAAAADEAGMADDCRCRCTPGGCTPMTYLLKGSLDTHWTNEHWAVEHASVHFARYLGVLHAIGAADNLAPKHHFAALRYLTFTVLQLPHTCCKPETALGEERYRAAAWSDEDVDAVEDEHAHGLALLEELIAEFESEVAAILQGPEPIYPPMHFWIHTWQPRMMGVLDGLRSCALGEDQKRGAEEIGVMWDDPAVRLTRNPHDEKTVNYWMYELKMIEEDCGVLEG